MSMDQPPPTEGETPGHDPLDELLSQAAWPEPAPLQVARLEQKWERLRPRRTGRWLIRVSAFAAAILMGVLWWQGVPISQSPSPPQTTTLSSDTHLEGEGRGEGAQRDIDRTPLTPNPVSSGPSFDQAVTHRERDAEGEGRGISRPATFVELALSRAALRRSELERRHRESDPLEQWVTRIMADPKLAIVAFDEPLEDRELLRDRLLAEMPRSQGQRRLALAKLQTILNLSDSTPTLLALWSAPFTRAVVEPRLVETADVLTLMEMSQARLTFAEQVRFLSEIAVRPDLEAQRLLLLAAMDQRFRRAAVIVAQQLQQPPAEMLFEALTGQHSAARTAAALLLGELDDPWITERLIQLARRFPRQSEPWVALLRKRDAAARAVVADARRDPQLYAAIISAEATRQSALPTIQWGAAL